LRDGVWYDIAYEPGTAVEKYQPDAGQPSDLDDFARLGRDLVVVLGHRAYGIVRSALPVRPVLLQNFPNPFNPETLIRFQLPAAGYVELAVYNLAGQRVRRLVAEDKLAGVHLAVWNGQTDRGNQAASGIYIYRLQAGGHVLSRRMLLVR